MTVLYRVTPGSLSVSPQYPAGQNSFKPTDPVALHIHFGVDRQGETIANAWAAVAIIKNQSGAEIARPNWGFTGIPGYISDHQDVDDVVSLGTYSAGTLNGSVTIQCR